MVVVTMEEMAEAKAEANLEKVMVDVENIFPSIFREAVNLPTVVYQDYEGAAIKGIGTEEFWLSPPYGRPRNIDYNTLKKFEPSEWIQMCTGAIIDALSQAEYDIVPMKKGDKPSEHEIDEPLTFLEHLPSEESFDQLIARVLPDVLWYDCGAITKVFPVGSFDDGGNMISDPGPPVDLHAIDGRSLFIEAPPVGNRWKRFWQYSWMSPTSLPTPFDVREVLYIQQRPSARGVYGTSALEVIQHTVNYLLDSTLATSKYWENGIHIGGQIDFPDVQDVDELKKRAKAIKAELQGAHRYNKWLTTGGNVKITPLQFTPQQMQWLDSQKWFSKIVMGIFKVSPSELGFCHTEDTEFLTESGWKKFDDIVGDERVGGWNQSTNCLEFNPPIKKYHYKYEGEVLHFKGKTVDCKVTPNHRMLVNGCWSEGWKVMPAEDIIKYKSPFYFKQSCNWQGREQEETTIPSFVYKKGVNQYKSIEVTLPERVVKTDILLQLLGWVASEGSLYEDQMNISQNEGWKADEIRNVVSRLPFKFGEYKYDEKNNISWITSDKQLCNYLLGIKENLPRWIFNLSSRQLQLLFDTLCKGDGTFWHDERDHREYYSCKKSLSDDIQELAIRCGYRTNCYNSGKDERHPNWNDLWIVSVSRSPKSYLSQSNVFREQYSGFVNCFQTPSGFLITRLNGKISIHHNTEDLNRATGIQQMNIYKSKALYPLMKRIERVINRQLIWADFSPRVKFQFRREMDYEDQIKQLEIYSMKVNNNFWSVNQVREDMGLDTWEPAFDQPMVVAQRELQPPMPDIFQQEGQGSEQIGAEEGEKLGEKSLKKMVLVGTPSGQPGFSFSPRVWDGQMIARFVSPQRKKLQETIMRAAEEDRRRVVEELKRRYALDYQTK